MAEDGSGKAGGKGSTQPTNSTLSFDGSSGGAIEVEREPIPA